MKHEDIAKPQEPNAKKVAGPELLERLDKVKAIALMLVCKVPIGAWVLVGAYVVYKLLIATAPTITPVEIEERSWPISAIPAVFADAQPEINLFGEVVAGREVEMRSLVSGQVVEVGPNFRDGGQVEEGELLVQIDPFEHRAALDDARAKRREARARLKSEQDSLVTERLQLDLAQRDFERALKHYNQLLAITPRMEEVLMNKAAALYRMARFEEAMATLKQVKESITTDRYDQLNQAIQAAMREQRQEATS